MPSHLSRPSRATLWRRRLTIIAAVAALVAGVIYAVQRSDDRSSAAATTGDTSAAVSSGAIVTAAPVDGDPGASTTTAPSPTASPDATFTLTAVGDTMLGKEGSLPPSPSTYFDPVHDDLTGDAQIVFANLEGTLTDATGGKCAGSTSSNCFAFKVPPSYAQDLAGAGFTVLNNANNHFHDFGKAGVDETLSAIQSAGMVQTGRSDQITVVNANGVKVAFIGFGPYSDMASLLDVPTAQSLVKRAKNMADVVVVYMHAGAEGTDAQHVTGEEETYVGEDRGNPQAFAHAAIDAGASLVLASGPHVLRGIEFYNGHLIAYSLGNFAGYGNFSMAGVLDDSAILRVTLDGKGAFRAGRLVPVQLTGKGQPVPGGSTVSLVAQLSRDDFGADAPTFAVDGTLTPP